MSASKLRQVLTLAGLGLGLTALTLGCEPKGDTVDPEPKPEKVEPKPEPVVWPDEPFRTERPKPKEIKSVSIPEIETFELDNGLKVNLVQQKTLPTVLMFFVWDYGSIDDPRGKAGVASICSDLLDEATKSKDKAAFSAAQDDHAVNVWASSGTENSFVGLRALQRELGAGLDLMAEMVLEPGLRQEDFDLLIKQEKNWIKQSTSSPTGIAYRIFPSLVWGPKHPYGGIETEASVDKVTLSDCKRWASKLKPDGASVWVVGKISKDELSKQLNDRLGKWKGKAPKAKKIAKPKPAAGTIFFVHVPGAAQSQIILGHPGPSRSAKDYEATEMMAAILGGSFSSRINMNLREDKGWAYGARGSFSYSRGGSYFAAGSSVRTDATGGAVREIAKEIDIMRTTDPKPEELQREQEGALLAMPANFATATRTLFSFRDLAFHGLPLDWHQGYQERLRALDTTAVRAAAETHLQESDHVVLVVGDGAVVLEDLEKIADEKLFGAGGIKFLDTDGKQVSRPSFDEEEGDAKKGDDKKADAKKGGDKADEAKGDAKKGGDKAKGDAKKADKAKKSK